MIQVEKREVYRANGGRRARLTLLSACKDAARAIVRKMAAETGDDLTGLMHEKRAQVDRVARMMKRRIERQKKEPSHGNG